ncbi:MAG: DegV family EDD domain-containing protein, partial [Gemmatimonadetes bacterium]|nr:DegV family EDD domain-containing protein [Gemmatimonadota bacterium]
MAQTRSPQATQPAVKRPVAVVTDSATALTSDMAAANGLFVAAMEVTIGDQTYVDGPVTPGGSLSRFYDLLRSADRLPTTSAPKPDRWLTCFRQAAARGESILCITIAAHLSASYDSARVATELAARELPGTPIRVINSNVAAGSQALVVLEAARRAAAGENLDEVEAAAVR